MWSLTKRFSFEAAHCLTHLPDGHKCKRPHGHSYVVELTVRAIKLDHRGFAGMDCAEMDVLGDYLRDNFDHRDLNQVMNGGENTTAERLAQYLYNWCCRAGIPGVHRIRVYETAKVWVDYGE